MLLADTRLTSYVVAAGTHRMPASGGQKRSMDVVRALVREVWPVMFIKEGGSGCRCDTRLCLAGWVSRLPHEPQTVSPLPELVCPRCLPDCVRQCAASLAQAALAPLQGDAADGWERRTLAHGAACSGSALAAIRRLADGTCQDFVARNTQSVDGTLTNIAGSYGDATHRGNTPSLESTSTLAGAGLRVEKTTRAGKTMRRPCM